MERASTRLRRLIERPGLIVAPICFDPLSARLAGEIGFECVALGGYALGSSLAASEPLLTMTEVVDAARRISSAVDLPLINRNVLTMMAIQPGVVPSTPNNYQSNFFTSAIRYSFNGGLESTSDFQVDGVYPQPERYSGDHGVNHAAVGR